MYDQRVVRELFEKWGHEQVEGDPGETLSRWIVPHVNHMVLDRWLPREGSALDAGSGCGIEAVRMARRGLAVTALDISTSLLRHAGRRAEKAGVLDRISFVQADLTQRLPLPEDYFDICIALTGVLGHVGDRHRDAAANLVACCKPGGLVIVGAQSYLGRIRQYLDMGKIAEAEHVADTRFTHTVSDTFEDYCFTSAELAHLLEELGCRVEEMVSAPTVAGAGYPDLSADDFARVLELERRFLGAPELLGAGEQLVGVFRKK
jgi:2-polyprenyl-3-methyl-5-hydroxy-6-metoxy-1,4-benzoquinol methylase